MVLEVYVDWIAFRSDNRGKGYDLALASALHPAHGYLFPKLQSLTIIAWYPSNLLASIVFLQPEVQAITVSLKSKNWSWMDGNGTNSITSFMGAAVSRCPDLLQLAVLGDSGGYWRCTSSRLSALIGQMTLLTTLDLTYAQLPKDSLFALLSDLPWLESINIEGNGQNGWLTKAVEEGALFEGAFPSLSSFQGSLSKELLKILVHPCFPLSSLESLTVDRCPSELIEELMQTISCLPLVELKLKMQSEQLRMSDLLQLSTLSNLRVLEIASVAPFAITEDELHPLIASWTKLKSIRLSNSSSITLRSVRSFLEHCTVISVMQINVDASELPEMAEDKSQNIEGNNADRDVGTYNLPPVELVAKGWKVKARDAVEEWVSTTGKQAGRAINIGWI